MRVFPCLILTLLLPVASARAASDDSGNMQALQALATQIKQAADQAAAGSPPTAVSVARLEHALAGFRDASSTNPSSQLESKYRAVTLLFGKLQFQASHPSTAPANPLAMPRTQMDAEVISDRHGASCKTALGISESLPVKVTLAQLGNPGSDAWFRFDPQNPGHFHFKTNSSGSDPAIEVFSGCAVGTADIAFNDDTFGLDASIAVARADRAPLFVHLMNTGKSGATVIGVQATSATISGTVTSATTGLPIAGIQIILPLSDGFGYGDLEFTDQNGNYSASVAAGTYYLRAQTVAYVSELYPDASCLPGYYPYGTDGCNIANAQTITVATGDIVAGIDLSLSSGHSVLGQVRDTDNTPLPASIALFDSGGNMLLSSNSDSVGHYSIATLPAGTYRIEAQASGYGYQMYDHIACGGALQTQCNLQQATAITIANQDVSGVNFSVPLLATIQGDVLGANSTPLANSTQVTVLDSFGDAVVWTYTSSNGHYIAGPLAPGQYYAFASSTGYFSQLFNAVDCAQNCTQNLAAATPISIIQTGQQAQASFQLHLLPVVHGHVQDEGSGLPLANVIVAASPNPPGNFYQVGWAMTDGDGNFALTNIPAGRYYLWARSDDHIDQVYSGIACEALYSYFFQPTANCDVTGAILLTISPQQTPGAFDFSLEPSSSINGSAITRAGAGSDLPANVEVDIFNGAGNAVAATSTDASGNYAVSDLPPGVYFAKAKNIYGQSYIEQIWQQMDCPSACAPTTGTPIALAQGMTDTGIDFWMTRRDAVVGRVTDPVGAPIGGALVDLFDSGTGNYVGSGVADAQGYYAAPGNLGYSYFAGTEAGTGYVDQVYAGISCPLGSAYYGLCSLTNATAIGLSNTSSQPHIVNFVLQLPDKIFANGFE